MKPKRSPARAALAEAIDALKSESARIDRLRAARIRASEAVDAAERDVADKRDAVEAAREAHVDRIASANDAGVNTMTAPATGVRQARADLVSAEDDLEIARGVLERCEQKLLPPPRPDDTPMTVFQRAMAFQSFDPLVGHRKAVDRAIEAVTSEHSLGIVAQASREAREAYLVAVRKGAVFAHLASRSPMSADVAATLIDNDLPIARSVPGAVVRPNSVNAWRAETFWPVGSGVVNHDTKCAAAVSEVSSAWTSALAALRLNPDAELPTL